MKYWPLASKPHYAEHIAAIWERLPMDMQGDWKTGTTARDSSIPADDIVLVAGYSDIDRAPNHRIIYIEHGAGQSYITGERAALYYHGGEHPDRVVGYISPRKAVADSWGRPAFAAGAPVCDSHDLVTSNLTPIAVLCFHWPATKVAPEATTALEHYADALPEITKRLASQGFDVVATVHPRDPFAAQMWRKLDIPQISSHEARETGDLILADNTSLAYELAYLGRGVITLNAPHYRRDVNHGLRFWDAAPGIQVDEPDELISLIDEKSGMLILPNATAAAVAAYGRPFNDGHDGLRAASWITAHYAN